MQSWLFQTATIALPEGYTPSSNSDPKLQPMGILRMFELKTKRFSLRKDVFSISSYTAILTLTCINQTESLCGKRIVWFWNWVVNCAGSQSCRETNGWGSGVTFRIVISQMFTRRLMESHTHPGVSGISIIVKRELLSREDVTTSSRE